MNKSDIVHLLQARFGYRRYLELRTPATGPDCRVDPARFDSFTKVTYQCPRVSGGIAREGCLDPVRAAAPPDIALLDPWHSHEQSRRDFEEVFDLLAPGGAIVCHDCWPPGDIVSSDGWRGIPSGALWSGETYAAYIDFVTARTDLDYVTVDADYGCGVIFKRPGPPVDPTLVREWQANRSHAWLAAQGHALLRLLSPAEFSRTFLGGATVTPAVEPPAALIVMTIKPGDPFCLEMDVAPKFRLALLDYTGSGHTPDVGDLPVLRMSTKARGKGEVLVHLCQQDLGAFDYIAIIDHDVVISVSAINRLLFLGRLHGLDLFQPSLSHDSYISHPHLAHRPGVMLRDTTFVETMTPFFSRMAFDLARDSFAESVSSWGLDYVWSSRVRQAKGRMAVIDCVMARHANPVTSQNWQFADGGSSLEDLQGIFARHGLEKYEIR